MTAVDFRYFLFNDPHFYLPVLTAACGALAAVPIFVTRLPAKKLASVIAAASAVALAITATWINVKAETQRERFAAGSFHAVRRLQTENEILVLKYTNDLPRRDADLAAQPANLGGAAGLTPEQTAAWRRSRIKYLEHDLLDQDASYRIRLRQLE